MRKRVKIALVVVFVAAIGFAAWEGLSEREPVYEGKPLSYWFRHWRGRSPGSHQAEVQLPALDSNAIPYLIRVAEKPENFAQKVYRRTRARMPSSLSRYMLEPDDPDWTRKKAFDALQSMSRRGIDIRTAIPGSLRVLKRAKPEEVRAYAVEVLEGFASSDPPVRAALVEALGNTEPTVILAAALALDRAGVAGREIVQPLQICLTNPSSRVRGTAMGLLIRAATNPAARAGVSTNAPGL